MEAFRVSNKKKRQEKCVLLQLVPFRGVKKYLAVVEVLFKISEEHLRPFYMGPGTESQAHKPTLADVSDIPLFGRLLSQQLRHTW